MDRLIDLIEEGDPNKILSEEDLFPRFNELVKYGLVVLKDEKVFLTKKVIRAKKEGLDLSIQKEKFDQIQDQFVLDQKFNNKNNKISKKVNTLNLIKRGIIMIYM